MKINDLLELILKQNFNITRSVTEDDERVSLEIPDWDCRLDVTASKSNHVLLSFNFLSKNNGKKDSPFPSFIINRIEDITPFLDTLFTLEQIDYNNDSDLKNSDMEHNNFIIDLFKKILSQESLPSTYSAEKIKNKKYPFGAIQLTDIKAGTHHHLNLLQFNEKFDDNKVYSLVTTLEIEVEISLKDLKGNYTGKIGETSFEIPGYEMHKYPLIQEQNKMTKIQDDLDAWLNTIITAPNQKRQKLQAALQHVVLNEEVRAKEGSKRQKRKI